MKKLTLLILVLALVAGGIYGSSKLKSKSDETKTQGEPAKINQTTPTATSGDNDLTVPELEDFDQEVQALDQSINQL